MTSTEILQIITGFLGSFGFAILFNIRGKRLLFAALGGFLSCALFVLLKFITESEPIRYFIVSVTLSLYAEVMARCLKTPTSTFIMTSLVPLIPGGSLYYTMASVFERSLENFLSKAAYTLSLAVSLALGIVLTSACAKFIWHKKKQ